VTVLQVELADLRGYADLVERGGRAADQVRGDAAASIPDGDFGRILELVTGDYEELLPAFRSILGEDSTRLDATARALRTTAREYAATDRRVAQTFGPGKAITDDGDASGFGDVAPVCLYCPSAGGRELPHVRFGFPWDQACDLAGWVGLPDPREWVTDQIVGDVGKADRQAASWEMYADAARDLRANLDHGRTAIAKTWLGQAADASDGTVADWVAALDRQSAGMRDMGGHLRDMVGEAVGMAQLVVDTIKFFISAITAGWSYASIPFYGQWKLVKTIKEAWHLINDARKVISVFWSFLTVMKDAIKGVVSAFTDTDLPAAPAVPAR
jgi:uncharacterized protein YukE